MSFGDINTVNTNVAALNARYSLSTINSKLTDVQQKLSTGLRINSAEDDAAGFSIASKLSAKIGGLVQASRNVSNAKSMLDVAESGMSEINDILISLKAKAVQGATDSIGDTERGYIANQINQMLDQITTIANSTKYQGKELLTGNFTSGGANGALQFQVGVGTGSSSQMDVALNSVTAGALSLALAANPSQADFVNYISTVTAAIDTLAADFNQLGIDQKSLSIRQDTVQQAIISNKAARSSIQDANFAKLESKSIRLQIQQQTAIAAFTQANASSQSVLQFLQ